jgi:hypothetical protein
MEILVKAAFKATTTKKKYKHIFNLFLSYLKIILNTATNAFYESLPPSVTFLIKILYILRTFKNTQVFNSSKCHFDKKKNCT